MLENIDVILFRPKYPENIGSVARACMNMGCGQIVLVDPWNWNIDKALPLATHHARHLLDNVRIHATLAEALAVAAYVREGRPDVTGKVGTIGFCWGGALVNQMAVNDPLVTATVSYYGRQPTAEETKKISAPIMLHYASLDDRINAGIPPFTAAMVEAGIPYTLHMYQDVNHAFHNDTNGARYDKAAADLSWQRTLEFLDRHLKA